jgi:RND family efflux transporter MFP subunit
MRPICSGLFLSLLAGLALSGCGESHADPQSQKPPAAIVTAGTPLEKPVTEYVEFTGRTDAAESVEIRARVTGFLKKVFFTAEGEAEANSSGGTGRQAAEGTEVKAGTPLYEIDDREYQADLQDATGELTDYLAQQEKADSDLKRAIVLKEKGNISTEEYERNVTAKKQADAHVESAEAKRDRAKLNVEFSHIAAAISGKISKTEITAGNLIRAENTLLTTIVLQDPIDVYFDMDERTLLTIRRLMVEGKVKGVKVAEGDDKEKFPVEMGLAIDEGYPKQGYIDFLDNRVNPATGTIRVRGVFRNPEFQPQRREMSPGMFCKIRVPLSQPHPALLIAERAIGTDQGRKFVYVINEKNEVVDRTIVPGPIQQGLRVVTSGLKADDKVIIDGMQRVRPGVEVAPKPARMDSRPGDAEADADNAPTDSAAAGESHESSTKHPAE